MRSVRRIFCGLVVVVAVTAATATATGGPATITRELADVNHNLNAYSRPDVHAKRIARVNRRRPITSTQTVLPVVAHATGARGSAWLRVLLPGRPNSHSGWIQQRFTTRAPTRWQVSVSTTQRRVRVYYNGKLMNTFVAVVGKPSTPTPRGRFFVEETVRLAQRDAGAPYALALSARSAALQEFAGGPGQIALHATTHLGGALGTAVTHGCLRLSTAAITWLAKRLGAGTPVDITA